MNLKPLHKLLKMLKRRRHLKSILYLPVPLTISEAFTICWKTRGLRVEFTTREPLINIFAIIFLTKKYFSIRRVSLRDTCLRTWQCLTARCLCTWQCLATRCLCTWQCLAARCLCTWQCLAARCLCTWQCLAARCLPEFKCQNLI